MITTDESGVIGFLDLRSIERSFVFFCGFRDVFPLRYEIPRFSPTLISNLEKSVFLRNGI